MILAYEETLHSKTLFQYAAFETFKVYRDVSNHMSVNISKSTAVLTLQIDREKERQSSILC